MVDHYYCIFNCHQYSLAQYIISTLTIFNEPRFYYQLPIKWKSIHKICLQHIFSDKWDLSYCCHFNYSCHFNFQKSKHFCAYFLRCPKYLHHGYC